MRLASRFLACSSFLVACGGPTSEGVDGAGGRASGGSTSSATGGSPADGGSFAAGGADAGGPPAGGGAPAVGGDLMGETGGGGIVASGGFASGDGGAPAGGTGAGASCGVGVPDTSWPTDCASRQRPICVPGTWAIGEPSGSAAMPAVRQESEHFALRWEGTLVSTEQASATLELFEDIWAQIIERIGFVEPFCDTGDKFKVNVHIRPDGGFTGSGVQGLPAMWVEVTGIGNRGLLAHEFTHTLQYASGGFRDSPYVGWMWESQADWMNHQQTQNRENLDCAGRAPSLANFPHLYYGSTRNRYCNWQFWEYLKDKHCPQAIADLWRNAPDETDPARLTEDPFSVLARNMNWSVSELNDFFAEWAMHNAAWDYRDPDGTDQGLVYRQAWGYSEMDLRGGDPPGNRRLRVTQLEQLPGSPGRYQVPPWWAPQRWGYNLVRLHPDGNASEVTVTFRGVVQEQAANTNFSPYADTPASVQPPDSDWRWGLVAVGSDGKARYSSLARGSEGELCFGREGTDTELWLVVMATPSAVHKIMWDQKYFSIYRYPWMVELTGAFPDGYQPGAAPPSAQGAPHENGGGWVAADASVAATAYVGPRAAVLGGAVMDQARIEDHAIVVDGVVRDRAVVGGLTILGGGLQVSGDAVLKSTFQSPGTFEPGQSISGSAQVLGDVELRGQGLSVTQGVFYGYIDAGSLAAPNHGASQTTGMVEVTSPGPWAWVP